MTTTCHHPKYGQRILVCEADGHCHTMDYNRHDKIAYADGAPTTVRGWDEFDGLRQWYRLDGAAWSYTTKDS